MAPLTFKKWPKCAFWRIIGLENMCSKEKCHFPTSFSHRKIGFCVERGGILK